MATESKAPKLNGGEIMGWPILKIDYPTEREKIAALLPPGFEAGEAAQVHLSIYCFPVPDEPEFGVLTTVDANYRGEKGYYAIGYGIDQESAIYISKDMNGQPKYPCEIQYYRLGDNVRAKCSHQGYTFLEFRGKTTGAAPLPEPHEENEWWVKVSRAVGGAEKAYDFPPHAVSVRCAYNHIHKDNVEGELLLRDSPWDPFTTLLPMKGPATAWLSTAMPTRRDIALEGPLDPDAFWAHIDTIGSSRWPGTMGGPRRES